MPRTINGRQFQWQLLEQIGKGDAGEVLRVQSQPGSLTALMKRPVQNTSGGTILRQAVQIENEGQILASLNGLDASRSGLLVHMPLLLDQSIPGTSRTSSLFIVSEEVPGLAISNLLKQQHQEDVSLSHVLALRVLYGLFLLLARVHEHGIAWNDVKMEHIFWDESSGKLSFIDWGNGIILGAQTPNNGQDPVWLDYQQFISEGNLLLNQVAPELIAKLDWPASAAGLTTEDLTQLQLRTEYLLSSLSMRVIDYQVLFRKQVQSIHHLEELKPLLELKYSLEALGMQVEKETTLQAIQQLAITYAQARDFAALEQLITLFKQHLPTEFGDVWQTADFLLALPDARQTSILPDLLTHIFSADWAGALWLLEGIRGQTTNLTRLSALQTRMRKAAGLQGPYAPPIYDQLLPLRDEAHLQLIHRHVKDGAEDPLTKDLEAFSSQLDALLSGWQQLEAGEMLGDKLLKLRELLRSPAVSLLAPPRELPKALNALLAKLREFFGAWSDGNLEACQQMLRELFLLEPSMTYLQQIDAAINALQTWMDQLSAGPEPAQTVTQFGVELLATQPKISTILSQPAWLGSLFSCAQALQSATDLEALRLQAQQQQWPLPWIDYAYVALEVPRELGALIQLNTAQAAALNSFHQALQAGDDPVAALTAVHNTLPEFYGSYRQLAQAFDALYSTLPFKPGNLEPASFPQQDRANIQEALAALAALQSWKAALSNSTAASVPAFPPNLSHWHAIQEAQASQHLWQEQLLPTLTAIRQREWEQLASKPASNQLPEDLAQTEAYLCKFAAQWQRLTQSGLYPELTHELIFLDDKAQELFFRFWQELEKTSQGALGWLVQMHQSLLSGINQALLQIARHLRELVRALDVINQPGIASSRMARTSAADIMFALAQLARLIEPDGKPSDRLQAWQEQYNQLLQQNNWQAFTQAIQSLDALHPLLPWASELVSRDIDIFTAFPNQKW